MSIYSQKFLALLIANYMSPARVLRMDSHSMSDKLTHILTQKAFNNHSNEFYSIRKLGDGVMLFNIYICFK